MEEANTGAKRQQAHYRLRVLGAALISATLIVIAGGGKRFLCQPVGAVYVVLWLSWWIVLAFGRRRGTPTSHNRGQHGVVVWGGVALVGFILGPPWEYAHLHGPLPRDGMLAWMGLTLFAAGIGVQATAFRALGERFTTRLGIQTVHQLVTRGPYRWVRHPAYLGYTITLTGMGLALSSLIGLGLTALVVPLIVRRIRAEEAMLEAAFGDAYRAYCRQTPWRLLPWIY